MYVFDLGSSRRCSCRIERQLDLARESIHTQLISQANYRRDSSYESRVPQQTAIDYDHDYESRSRAANGLDPSPIHSRRGSSSPTRTFLFGTSEGAEARADETEDEGEDEDGTGTIRSNNGNGSTGSGATTPLQRRQEILSRLGLKSPSAMPAPDPLVSASSTRKNSSADIHEEEEEEGTDAEARSPSETSLQRRFSLGTLRLAQRVRGKRENSMGAFPVGSESESEEIGARNWS